MIRDDRDDHDDHDDVDVDVDVAKDLRTCKLCDFLYPTSKFSKNRIELCRQSTWGCFTYEGLGHFESCTWRIMKTQPLTMAFMEKNNMMIYIYMW